MGYCNRLNGRIAIDPPLSWSLVRELNDLNDLTIEQEREVRETDDGTTTVIRGVALSTRFEDDARCRSIETDLARVVNAVPDRTFHGWLVREGEQQGDVQRYAIVDGKVATETATMSWPDGTAAP